MRLLSKGRNLGREGRVWLSLGFKTETESIVKLMEAIERGEGNENFVQGNENIGRRSKNQSIREK